MRISVDKTVNHGELVSNLISSGDSLLVYDGVRIIEDMVENGKQEEVLFHTYRRGRRKDEQHPDEKNKLEYFEDRTEFEDWQIMKILKRVVTL